MKKLTISFGAMSPKLTAQLKKQGLKYDRNFVEQIQRDVDAVLRLAVRGLLTNRQARSVEKKLFGDIKAALR